MGDVRVSYASKPCPVCHAQLFFHPVIINERRLNNSIYLFFFQPPSGMIVGCQCSKCPFHGTKDQETRLKSDSKNFTNHASPAVHVPTPNNNHIHSNHCHPQHIVPPPPTPLHCPLEDPPQDLSGLLLDSSLRQINYNGYHNNLDGCAEVDGGENSLSDSNSEYEDDDEDDDDDDDDEEEEDDGSSCSPRRTSQCSGT